MAHKRQFSCWLAMLILWICSALKPIAAGRGSDAPSAKNFLRWAWGRTIVLNDFLYIDGGIISQLEDGEVLSGSLNSTISISLSASWSTDNTIRRSIPKLALKTSWPAVWADTMAGVFYSWGGSLPDHKVTQDSVLWKFTADGYGGGTWSEKTSFSMNPDLGFKQLHTTQSGVVVTVNNTIGLYMGGVAPGWTERGLMTTEAIPGLVEFDIQRKTWHNFSTFEFNRRKHHCRRSS